MPLTVSSDSEDEAPRFRRTAAFKKKSANSSPGSQSESNAHRSPNNQSLNANNANNSNANNSLNNDLDKSDLKEMSPFNALELPLSIFQRRQMEADIARRQKAQAAEAQMAQKRQMEEMQKQMQVQRMEEIERRVQQKAAAVVAEQEAQNQQRAQMAQRKGANANDSFVPISRATGVGSSAADARAVSRPAESGLASSAASAAVMKGANVATNTSTSSPSSSSRNKGHSPPLAPAASRLTHNINVRPGVKSNTNSTSYGALLSNSSRNVGHIPNQTPPQVHNPNRGGSNASPLSYSALLNQSPSILTATGYTNQNLTATSYTGYNNNRIDNGDSRIDNLSNSVSSSVRLPSAVAGNLSPESRKRTAPWYQKVIEKEGEVARLQGVMSERN